MSSENLVERITLDSLGCRIPSCDVAAGIQQINRVSLYALQEQARLSLSSRISSTSWFIAGRLTHYSVRSAVLLGQNPFLILCRQNTVWPSDKTAPASLLTQPAQNSSRHVLTFRLLEVVRPNIWFGSGDQ
jgi:hypothetical protein